MLLLEDGHLAVGFQEWVLIFEADSLRRAMLESMHIVTHNASLAADSVTALEPDGVTALELLKGGQLAVGTSSSGVLLFQVASLSRTVTESRMQVQASDSLAASVANCLQQLGGWASRCTQLQFGCATLQVGQPLPHRDRVQNAGACQRVTGIQCR